MYHADYKTYPYFAETGFYFQHTGGRILSNRLHDHNFYELLYLRSGRCVHEVDGKPFMLRAGSLTVLTPRPKHRFLEQTEGTDIIALSVTEAEMHRALAVYEKSNFFADFFTAEVPPDECRTILRLAGNLASANPSMLTLRMLLNQMLLFCVEDDSERTNPIPAAFAQLLAQMRRPEYAAQGLHTFVSLSGFSHSQLCRLTQKWLGLTPGEYVCSVRLQCAYDLLLHSNLDLQTICEQVGFSSFSYFSRKMKEYYGDTPSKLRASASAVHFTV